jgi:hypothetical protein
MSKVEIIEYAENHIIGEVFPSLKPSRLLLEQFPQEKAKDVYIVKVSLNYVAEAILHTISFVFVDEAGKFVGFNEMSISEIASLTD